MNIYNVSENNKTEVLKSIILNNTLMSRADISRELKINKATISRIVNELIQKNIIYEYQKGDSTVKGGKKPLLINVNKNNILIGMYLLKNKYQYIFTDIKGNEIKSGNYKTNNESDFLSNLKNFFRVVQNETNNFNPIAYNIVIPGIVNSDDNKIIYSGEFDLSDMDINDITKKYFKAPVFLENDANAAAVGYKFFENPYASDFIFILLRIDYIKSILYSGCGIIINDRLIKGYNNFAGEFLLFNTEADKTIILNKEKWKFKTKYEKQLLDKIMNTIFFLNTPVIIVNQVIKNNQSGFLKKIKNSINKIKSTYKGFNAEILISNIEKIALKGSVAILIDKIINSDIKL